MTVPSEEPPPAAALGRAIALRRTALDMKRKDLAHAAGLSYPYISEIENGAKEPSAKALRRIAEALQLSERDLVTLRDQFDDDETSSVTNQPILREALAMNPSMDTVLPATSIDASDVSEVVRRIVREELAIWESTRLQPIVEETLRRLISSDGSS